MLTECTVLLLKLRLVAHLSFFHCLRFQHYYKQRQQIDSRELNFYQFRAFVIITSIFHYLIVKNNREKC